MASILNMPEITGIRWDRGEARVETMQYALGGEMKAGDGLYTKGAHNEHNAAWRAR